MQETIPTVDFVAQSLNPIMLDGVQSKNQLTPLVQPILIPLNLDCEAMMVITSHQLSQNIVLNMDLVNLQGSF